MPGVKKCVVLFWVKERDGLGVKNKKAGKPAPPDSQAGTIRVKEREGIGEGKPKGA